MSESSKSGVSLVAPPVMHREAVDYLQSLFSSTVAELGPVRERTLELLAKELL